MIKHIICIQTPVLIVQYRICDYSLEQMIAHTKTFDVKLKKLNDLQVCKILYVHHPEKIEVLKEFRITL